ncbi:two-component sensor histidine kinase [Virgisporangium aliadipatigenens]|uniref:histidine kinase n=1 Tax=Virgisporangium aliadipatigenens TaxID=741659 RepID=A0A8J3YVV5_9ACTN|nr:HAMP domain-containing sensor histidine kinase [Virgisporangium aliadipatigenens]GIJ51442.1 two-component sensor histidine kinase [Virgisporangium aliadipatigenens]
MTVRARLTLVNGAFLSLSSGALLVLVYLVVRLVPPFEVFPVDKPELGGAQAVALSRSNFLDVLLWACIGGFVVVSAFGMVAAWIIAGRVLRPLDRITATANAASTGTLHERIALTGPDDELKRLADTLDSMLARLDAEFQAHRRFAANAAHELRTPLAASRTVLQVARANPAAYDVATLAAQLLVANQRSIDTTEALLALADATHAPLAPEVVDLTAIVAEETPDGVGLHLEPTSVDGDPVLLRRLVANLVDNAVRHNDARRRVEIALHDETLRITNTGPVVSDVERLFEPFYREAGRVRGGHGLGLAIVRAVADAHRAALSATANPTGGLAVTVAFRRAP